MMRVVSLVLVISLLSACGPAEGITGVEPAARVAPSTAGPGPAATSTESYDIRGTVIMSGGPNPQHSTTCVLDIRRPMFLVKDRAGRSLGELRIKPGTYPRRGGCRAPYAIGDVPAAESYDFYLTANPGDIFVSYSFEEMQARLWRVDLHLPMK